MILESVHRNLYRLKTDPEILAAIRDIFATILQFSNELSPDYTNEHIADVLNRDLVAIKAILDKATASGQPEILLSGELLRAFFNTFSELDALTFNPQNAGLEQHTYQSISQEVNRILMNEYKRIAPCPPGQ